MTNRTRKLAKPKVSLAKPLVKRFTHMANKPPQPKKGISYAVEKAENIDAKTGKKIDGDVFKKYENGVLKRQIFVPKSSVKKLIQKHVEKMKKKIGGKTQKRRKVLARQAPVPVTVQDGTTSGQAFKTGIFSGLGFGLANTFVGSLFGDDYGYNRVTYVNVDNDYYDNDDYSGYYSP
jgi:hypothetical protein